MPLLNHQQHLKLHADCRCPLLCLPTPVNNHHTPPSPVCTLRCCTCQHSGTKVRPNTPQSTMLLQDRQDHGRARSSQLTLSVFSSSNPTRFVPLQALQEVDPDKVKATACLLAACWQSGNQPLCWAFVSAANRTANDRLRPASQSLACPAAANRPQQGCRHAAAHSHWLGVPASTAACTNSPPPTGAAPPCSTLQRASSQQQQQQQALPGQRFQDKGCSALLR
jgi:hypothetical protein